MKVRVMRRLEDIDLPVMALEGGYAEPPVGLS
jgi:hypothetical protein